MEIGKKADIIIYRTDSPQTAPDVNPVANMVFSGNGRDVDTTIIDGQIIMKNREFLNIDVKEVIEEANKSINRMIEKSELDDSVLSLF